jgi:hypothetical protein
MTKPAFSSPTVLLYAYVVLSSSIAGIYLAAGLELPPGYDILHLLGSIWIFGWWLQWDSRQHHTWSVMDIGMFVGMAWPLLMPCYLLRTRGAKALLIIGVFIVIYLAPLVLGGIVRVALTLANTQ